MFAGRRNISGALFMKKTVSELEKSVRELSQKVADLQNMSLSKPVYTNREAVELFGVKPQTLRRWRQKGKIGYSQHGKTTLYSEEDIRNFLKTFHKNPDKQ